MKKQIWKAIGGASLVILVLAVFAQVWVSAQNKTSELFQDEQSLTGSWDVQVTIRDCETGVPLFGFPAMITYNQGGTMEESDLGAPVLVRLNGHGVWRHQTGRNYSSAFRWLNFNPDRSFAGTNVVRSSISLGLRGNEYTSTDKTDLIDPNGTVTPVACATTTATRFD
jgi:hypothetical protein